MSKPSTCKYVFINKQCLCHNEQRQKIASLEISKLFFITKNKFACFLTKESELDAVQKELTPSEISTSLEDYES